MNQGTVFTPFNSSMQRRVPIYISKRERQIIELLLNQETGVKLEILGEALGVSNRTVYRELSNLESTLKNYEITLDRNSEKGYQLVGTASALKEINNELTHLPKELSIQQRQNLLMIQLLLSEYEIKMEALALNLQVSVGTIQTDLDEIAEMFKEYQIEIQRKKSKGIQVIAKESNLRLIIAGLISSEINEYYFSQLLNHFSKVTNNSFWNKNENIFLGILNKDILIEVYSVLKEFNQDLFTQANDFRFQRIIILLTISIMRIKAGYFLEKDNQIMETPKNVENLESARIIFDKMKKRQLIKKVPEREIHFFSFQLEGINIDLSQDFFDDDYDVRLNFQVSELVRKVSNQMEWDFNQDKSLYNDLLQHISAAVKRTMTPMPTNDDSLLHKIHSQYKELSIVVEKNLKEIFDGIDFRFEEIIYIVLHFASTYEKIIAKQNVSVLVICSSGIGMAKILKNRLQKNILEISTITTARVAELEDLNLREYDLILSTIFLDGFEFDYKLVTPLLMDDEIKSVRQSIQLLNKERTIETNPLEEMSIENSFQNFYDKMTIAHELLEQFDLQKMDDYTNINDLIGSICVELEQKGILSNPRKIKDKLLARMNTAPIGFPNTNMALFHCVDRSIYQPYFGIYDQTKSLPMNAFNQEKIKMNRVLLMIGPDPLSQNAQEILGLISSNIVESDLSLDMFNTASKNMMKNYLNILFLENYKK